MWGKACLENETVTKLVKKFPIFYGIHQLHRCIHRNMLLGCIRRQLNPVCIYTLHFFKIQFNVVLCQACSSGNACDLHVGVVQYKSQLGLSPSWLRFLWFSSVSQMKGHFHMPSNLTFSKDVTTLQTCCFYVRC